MADDKLLDDDINLDEFNFDDLTLDDGHNPATEVGEQKASGKDAFNLDDISLDEFNFDDLPDSAAESPKPANETAATEADTENVVRESAEVDSPEANELIDDEENVLSPERQEVDSPAADEDIRDVVPEENTAESAEVPEFEIKNRPEVIPETEGEIVAAPAADLETDFADEPEVAAEAENALSFEEEVVAEAENEPSFETEESSNRETVLENEAETAEEVVATGEETNADIISVGEMSQDIPAEEDNHEDNYAVKVDEEIVNQMPNHQEDKEDEEDIFAGIDSPAEEPQANNMVGEIDYDVPNTPKDEVAMLQESGRIGCLRWYSGASSDRMFEISKAAESATFNADEECKTIHVNAGYDTYGWEVQFFDGVVMNLRDVREYQIRNGRLPSADGRIVYGQSAWSFSGIERIVVYESVKYFSYGV